MNIKINTKNKDIYLLLETNIKFIISFCTLIILFYFKLLFKKIIFFEYLIVVDFFIIIYFLICNLIRFAPLWFKKYTDKIIYLFFLFSYFSLIARSTSLYFSRLIQNKNGLLWSTDSSFALHHANAISRYSDFSQTLSLSEYQESYHFGPAILSGLLDKFSIANVQISTLLIIPFICCTVFTISIFLLVFKVSNNFNISFLLTAILTFTPTLFLNYSSLIILPESFLNFYKQLSFSQDFVMQNSFMVGVAILAAFSLVFFNSKFYLFSYSLIIFSFVSKPQYSIAGLIIILNYYFLDKFRFKFLLKDLKKILFPKNSFLFYLVSIFWVLTLSYINKDIKLELASFSLVRSNYEYIFNEIFNYKINILKIFLFIMLLFPLVSFLYKNPINEKYLNLTLYKKLLKINYIFLFLYPIIYFLCLLFPIVSKVDNTNSIAIINLYKDLHYIEGYTITSNNLQILVFIKSVMIIITLINSFLYLINKFPNSYRYFFSLLIMSISYSNLCFYTLIKNPLGSLPTNPSNESKLLSALKEIPISNSIIITNEHYYPNRKEPYNATNLSALSKHQFFISNIKYSRQYLKSGVLERIQENENFFNSDWDEFHYLLLKKNNISHILIRKNNSLNNISWFKYHQKINILEMLNENEEWIIFKVNKSYF